MLLCLVLCLMPFCQTLADGRHRYTLVIDAGHGGRDGGACANGAREKDINLNVALAFGRLVEQNCQDVRVIYTRKTDVFIPLHERADIANRNHADVFISIHTNSVARGRVAGMETYTMGMRRSDEKLSAAMRENEVILIEGDYQQHYAGFDPRVPESYIIFDIVNEANMAESVRLAQLIQQKTCATAHRTNKGVKQDAFLVLRETSMPACLIELGYITTPSEATFLTSRDGVNALARGIYQAFVAYRGQQAAPATTPAAPQRGNAATPSDSTEGASSPSGGGQEGVSSPSGGGQEGSVSPSGGGQEGAVFKVQILASTTELPAGDRQFKGLAGVESYREGNLWKYTVGSSTDYNEIARLRRNILDKFPQAFIIAFKNGQKVDTQEAIREFRVRN